MHTTNEALIKKFYTAFQQRDFKTMQDCYHDDAIFHDPVFQTLNSKEVKAMWQMLMTSAKDLTLTFSAVKANSETGSCDWIAVYPFSQTNRMVRNEIRASFEFKDGKIYRHRDVFDLWKWTRMALGGSGYLLGWTPIVKNKVRSKAKQRLNLFMQKR